VIGSLTRSIGAAVATVAVTATVVATGTGALVAYRSASTETPTASTRAYPSTTEPSATAPQSGTPSTSAASTEASAAPTDTAAHAATAVRGPFSCPSVDAMPLRAALAQTLLIGVSGANTSGPRGITDGSTPVGGIFLYSSSHDLAFTSGILRTIAEQSPPPIVAVDDEGGSVQRLNRLFGPLPSARSQGGMDPDSLRQLATRRGHQLASVGVTLNFAPVLDLGGNSTAIAQDRTFAVSANDVSTSATAVAAGMRQAGILPAVGHFPGMGRSAGNPVRGLPVTPDLNSLRSSDLIPFQRVFQGGPTAVLIGNVNVPGLTSRRGLAATLDPATYRLLREDLKFTGLAITADLSGQAGIRSSYSTAQATIEALAAGADMVTLNHPGYLEPLLDSMTAAVRSGKLPESRVREAAGRVLASKGCQV
jgi:beta-N-acetylhexosaminidase